MKSLVDIKMWRTTYQIPKLIRNHRSGAFVRSSQQNVNREESADTIASSSTSENVASSPAPDYLKQVSRPAHQVNPCLLFIRRKQQYDGHNDGHSQDSGRKTAGADWDEWFRSFRQDFWNHTRSTCLIEAVGFSTVLLLGFHLSQYGRLWTQRHLQCHNKPGDQAWLGYHLHQMALALPIIRQHDMFCARSHVLPSGVTSVMQPQQVAIEYEDPSTRSLESDRVCGRKPKERDKLLDVPDNWSNKVEEWITVDNQETNLRREAEKKEHCHPTADTEQPTHNIECPLADARQSWSDLSHLYVQMATNSAACQNAQSGDIQMALSLWKKSSDLGASSFNLGVCYEFGRGTEVDLEKARQYYETAASLGHPLAMCNLAGLCLRGEGGPKDLCSALDMYQKAAALNITKAQANLGVLYAMSEDNAEKAATLFERAAENKDISGVYNLGLCYQHGFGMDVNICRAAELYARAAQQGHAAAQFVLAGFFRDGLAGLPEDLTSARAWYQRAADQGHTEAAKCLSDLMNIPPQSDVTDMDATCSGDQSQADASKDQADMAKLDKEDEQSRLVVSEAEDVQLQDSVRSVLDCLPREKYPVRKSASRISSQGDDVDVVGTKGETDASLNEAVQNDQTNETVLPLAATDKYRLDTIMSEGLFGEERFPTISLVGSFSDIQLGKPRPKAKVKKKRLRREDTDLGILRAFGVDYTEVRWGAGTSVLDEHDAHLWFPPEGVQVENQSAVSTI